MRVLITGAGFIGSHTVAAVVRAGHDLRLLVRRRERVGPALAPFGLQAVDVVTGDVLDARSVQRAIDGCDAVIHAAALYSMDPREGQEAFATNRRATAIVLQAAVQARLDPIVHVSSYAAMPPSRNLLSADSPIGVGGPLSAVEGRVRGHRSPPSDEWRPGGHYSSWRGGWTARSLFRR